MHMEFRWGNLWKVTTWKTKTTGLCGETSTQTHLLCGQVLLRNCWPGDLVTSYLEQISEYFRQLQKESALTL
jgi:hypothetical protein